MQSRHTVTSFASLACVAVFALGCDKGASSEPAPVSSVKLELPGPSAPTASAPPIANLPEKQTPFDPAHPEVGGVRFTAPDPFVYRAPQGPMRAAEYVITGTAQEGSAVLAVHYFPGMGGTADANVKRWVSQFKQPDGRDSMAAAKVDKATINGLEVVRVDVSGSYSAMQMQPSAEPQKEQENQRLLGAIVMAPSGPVFFKLVGPAKVMQSAMPAFDGLVASFAPAH